jgi:hypothetical protein
MAFSAQHRRNAFPFVGEPLARSSVRQRRAILIDEHRLMLQPLLPRLFRDVLVDARRARRIRRKIDPFGFAAELPLTTRDMFSPANPLKAP